MLKSLETPPHSARFVVGHWSVAGVTAEVLSVLAGSPLLKAAGLQTAVDKIVEALDTATPPEERVPKAVQLLQLAQRHRRLARWLPWYSGLPKLEYDHKFHRAYRDHSIHTLQVFLLGLYFYETVASLRNPLDARLEATGCGLSQTEAFLEWWCLSSLWHDLGYLFESESFITDAQYRSERLAELSEALSSDAFVSGFDAAGASVPPAKMREIYRLGRFYPYRIGSVSDLLGNVPAYTAIQRMWQRLGVGSDRENVPHELDRLTTQAAVGRPPHHDHGLFSALLLGTVCCEADSFLQTIAESATSSDPSQSAAIDVALSAWHDFASSECLIAAATEAIAFHSIDFLALDQTEVRALLPTARHPSVSLSREPLLFFLAFVDTLQDWDRHHFVPSIDGQHYRPALRASDVLIQGSASQIRVSFSKPDASLSDIRRLFDTRLEQEDLSKLFSFGATFSEPKRLLSVGSTTVEASVASIVERTRLEGLIASKTSKARELLIKGEADAIMGASNLINGLLSDIANAQAALTASDRDAVQKARNDHNLAGLEIQVSAMIKEGTRLPFGTVKRRIGWGGFGTVYEITANSATETPMRALAFKLFHDHELHVEEKRRLFRRGYDAMSRLNGHRNIVSVYAYSELPVGFYMEFVPGHDLAAHIPTDDIRERLQLALTICEAVAAGHAQGIIHRDIKPGNVLLDAMQNSRPVITDFDLAWIEGNTQHTKIAYASVSYGAPEQFEDKRTKWKTSPTVDVFGCGALLYYLVSNQQPPPHATWQAAHWDQIEHRLVGALPAVVVQQIVELLRNATMAAPDSRIQEIEEVVFRLSHIVSATTRTDERMSREEWIAEVKYRANGLTDTTLGETISSKTGATSSTFGKHRWNDDRLSLDLICQLNGEPRYEGVNYEGFQKGSVRQIDKRIQSFEKETGIAVHRHGQFSGAGSTVRFEVARSPLTSSSAALVGQLLASISRIVE
jgi:serine/threonine protein kinase